MNTIQQHTIRKILIANRGEIAVRVMRTCRRLGIFSAAVYSDVDAGELFVRSADEAIRIGGRNPSESYLDQDKIIDAARRCGADAIHPGYGFLSENAAFAARCAQENIIFIGPNSKAIEAMGSKITAKSIMKEAGVPVIPGYDGSDQDTSTLKSEALKIGFPVLLKASAGGGGKGMRVVREEKDLDKAITAAKREAKNAFGDDDLLIEKYFESSRHIEIQVFGDKHGNHMHLGERECSIQRRHQKIIEESPSPVITETVRAAMGDAAVKAAEAIQYDNAGTVEFIYSTDGDFYFLEVNTRLQVEHPVTEMVTGLDLVEMQINIASGRPLGITQEEVAFHGHAIECRLYAEDPGNDFLPATGKILHWEQPDAAGLRFDTGVTSGSGVSVFYDPMIAKIIAHGNDREEALNRMQSALSHLEIAGLTHNRDFLLQVLRHEGFRTGDFDTHFLENDFHYDPDPYSGDLAVFAAAALARDYAERKQDRAMLQEVPAGWRNNFYQPQTAEYSTADGACTVRLDYRTAGESLKVTFTDGEDTLDLTVRDIALCEDVLAAEIDGIRRQFHVTADGHLLYIHTATLGSTVLKRVPRFPDASGEGEPGGYNAPMPGQVIDVLVEEGQAVKKGDVLLVLLSMKMENAVEALEDGEVEAIYAARDSFVEAGSPLIKIKVD